MRESRKGPSTAKQFMQRMLAQRPGTPGISSVGVAIPSSWGGDQGLGKICDLPQTTGQRSDSNPAPVDALPTPHHNTLPTFPLLTTRISPSLSSSENLHYLLTICQGGEGKQTIKHTAKALCPSQILITVCAQDFICSPSAQ